MEARDPALLASPTMRRRKVAIAKDQEKQERIDQVVKELWRAQKHRKGSAFGRMDIHALTLWIMDFRNRYSLQEGEERLLVAGLSEALLEKSRVQLWKGISSRGCSRN